MQSNEEWVELCATNSDSEARLIVGFLESNGFAARLKSYKVSQFPFDIGHIGEIKIMVLKGDLEGAKEIIAEKT